MRRTNWKTVSTLVTMAVVVGCADNGISTPRSVSVAPAPMMLAPDGRPQLSLAGALPSTLTADFTITPAGGVALVGNHAVVFPANSVCDPATSGYGAASWDAPCTPLTKAITVHASVSGSSVDFTPSIRFVPSSDASRWVWLFLYTPSAIGRTGDLSAFNIYYAPTAGGALVDETSSDPTLRTYVDTRSGVSVRRVKHFSGYTSSARCDPAVDPSCSPTDPPPPN